ncbi:hypothetical protein EDD85DRAFT_806519 [Armillaria nabsnona]|nr:hypothetical protein EDD85DRAFT_806519 [Armillaria nabsnona]
MSAYSPNYCLKAFRAEARSHVLSWLSLLAVSYRVVDALPIRLAAYKMCMSKFHHIHGAFHAATTQTCPYHGLKNVSAAHVFAA